jgi:hypothetical protein
MDDASPVSLQATCAGTGTDCPSWRARSWRAGASPSRATETCCCGSSRSGPGRIAARFSRGWGLRVSALSHALSLFKYEMGILRGMSYIRKEWDRLPGRCVFASVHIHPAPQHGDHRHAVGRPSKAILAALRGRVCKILHPNFREFLFHALR